MNAITGPCRTSRTPLARPSCSAIGHRGGPLRMSLEPKRCRHRAVAIPIVAVADFVTASAGHPGRNRTGQKSFKTLPRSVGTAANRSMAASASCRSV